MTQQYSHRRPASNELDMNALNFWTRGRRRPRATLTPCRDDAACRAGTDRSPKGHTVPNMEPESRIPVPAEALLIQCMS